MAPQNDAPMTRPKQSTWKHFGTVQTGMQKGPFGYSDMAFRTATRLGIGEGPAKAEPVLLEPIEHVTASVPNIFTAAAQRLLTGRRGQILGYAERPGWPGWEDVEALVPAAELHDFIIELRSDTMGLGLHSPALRSSRGSPRHDALAEGRGEFSSVAPAIGRRPLRRRGARF
jgi:hypothetical protein